MTDDHPQIRRQAHSSEDGKVHFLEPFKKIVGLHPATLAGAIHRSSGTTFCPSQIKVNTFVQDIWWQSRSICCSCPKNCRPLPPAVSWTSREPLLASTLCEATAIENPVSSVFHNRLERSGKSSILFSLRNEFSLVNQLSITCLVNDM